VLQKKGHIELAIICFRKTLEIDPDNVTYYGNLAAALEKQEKFNEAIDYYRQAIQKDHSNNSGYACISDSLLAKVSVPELKMTSRLLKAVLKESAEN
jgi:tetratricopeptide (TPR) repeat protein